MASGKWQGWDGMGWDGMGCDAMRCDGKNLCDDDPPIFLLCSYSLNRSLSYVIKFAGSH